MNEKSTANDILDQVFELMGKKDDRAFRHNDFIEIDDDPEVFLRDVLKPAKVQSIESKDKKATIKVEEDQKPVALGKKASNIKLASQIM